MMDEQATRRSLVLVCGSTDLMAARIRELLPECQVDWVSTGQEALDRAASAKVDLVLTDRERSGEDNVLLLHQLRGIDPETRVIILAHPSTREDVIAAIRGGVFCYFSRPHFEAVFHEVVRHAVAGGKWRDAIHLDSATHCWLRMTAQCDPATAERALQFMHELSDLDGKERESMGFALKEMVLNAMEYGGQFRPENTVDISCVRARRMILYRVQDPGPGFSLDGLAHAAISNPPDEPVRHFDFRETMGIRPGGFGVLLTRRLVDELIYSEKGNDVLLIKYVTESGNT